MAERRAMMILKSKLSKTAYPIADPDQWVTGDKADIDPVVLGRLAYAGKTNNKVIVITEGGGYRSYSEQVKMYNLYKAGKLQATAAVPGTSWHGSGLAVDTSTYPIRGMTSAQLKKYGLCKPLSKEPWHIQPIETATMGAKCNMSLAPEDLGPPLKTKFGLADNTVDYIAAYKYAADLATGLLAGKKDFAAETMKYLYSYKYWESLREKLAL
jgi:hypothetical protein